MLCLGESRVSGFLELDLHSLATILGTPCYWSTMDLQNCLSSSWHRFSKVLETFELRPGDLGGHLSAVNSLLGCSV